MIDTNFRNNKFQLEKPLIALFLIYFLFFTHNELKAQFANGADIGWLSEMEDDGYIFKDNSGIEKNCLDILKEKGINALRFRVWVNPKDGYCSKKDVAYMAQRANNMGFDVMLDFHYSDYWADPGKQNKPAAWVNHTVDELLTDIYDHTYEVLDTLKQEGVIPKWVQIGNEVNNGMLWEDGKASVSMSNFASMIKSGYNAVKDVDSTIHVIVHLSNGHDNGLYRWMFDGLKNNGAKWDIIGMSVYPYWAELPWQEDNEKSLSTMKDIIARYNTKIMVCETGYLYNKPIEANQFLLDLIEKTKSVNGLGVFYWEPESYNKNGYQLGAWDPITKQPTVALDAFLGINPTSVKDEQELYNYKLDIYPNPFNPKTTITYSVPNLSSISINIYNMLGEEIAQLVNGEQSPGTHNLTWNANNIPSGVYFCKIEASDYLNIKKVILLK
ncbi:MAG: glycosyl hydrolase 53 family protein [Ignavibacteriae bacterium]|nr:glycosyl hydrolase 53 family protein [Ignavibacteriota bacterium]MCB0746104.1 glycosyl hydrolase 53 family protein [Ignavibacteriota bacterium]